MHFHKYPFHSNFEFVTRLARTGAFTTAKGKYTLETQSYAGDIHRVTVRGPGWTRRDAEHALNLPGSGKAAAANETRLKLVGAGASLTLTAKDGTVLLNSRSGRFFGQCGRKSLFEFVSEPGDNLYGYGEKWLGFEHSGKTTKFWNTDVWGDFNESSFRHGKPAPDPVYVSIPYAILKRGNTFIGLLLDNPYATFISSGSVESTDFEASDVPGAVGVSGMPVRQAAVLQMGAEEGQPSLIILVGPSLAELTRKFQQMVGTTPLPPAWALGYHQCRWGYRSAADLNDLDANFRKHGIPADGLWLDIDYMRGYRVFTFDKANFANPKKELAKLNKAGRRVVPIIDPGVKHEPGYPVYDRGHKAKAFCENPQGGEYIGLVWPGHTAFPDYSDKKGADWWTGEVRDFAALGLYGAWLDMNDPSTGKSENDDMLFQDGKRPHTFYHNQYAYGMAKASRAGFLAAHPKDRPFLLCRSGCTGSGAHTAIWTGDNVSNYHHLRNSIPTTLNLALSGIPFNGPDVGGFGFDTEPKLIRDWYKACFLFPVMRNHTIINSRAQEPWAFGPALLKVLRQYIRLRYRLRPYLYQLFAAQERLGEAILRPLFYDFASTGKLPLELVDDQFMVGPSIMQAPFVEENQTQRKVVLPGEGRWYDLSAGAWVKAGRTVKVTSTPETTPIYVREGAILPLARLAPEDHAFNARQADFHVFLGRNGTAETTYVFDDGQSFAYREGKRSEVKVAAKRSGTTLHIEVTALEKGYGAGAFTFSAEASVKRVLVNGAEAKRVDAQGVPLTKARWTTWQA